MIIEIVVTVASIWFGIINISDTLITNVDKESRRPSSRRRQSENVVTLIFNSIKVEEVKLSDRRKRGVG
jgi:hypothetical protein